MSLETLHRFAVAAVIITSNLRFLIYQNKSRAVENDTCLRAAFGQRRRTQAKAGLNQLRYLFFLAGQEQPPVRVGLKLVGIAGKNLWRVARRIDGKLNEPEIW